MAKAIATITGTALAPGVSRNRRLYTKENIGKMVARASERIAAGKRPIAMYTSHDSTDVADVGGVLTSIWQEADGRARYTAEVPDTSAGRTVAALADTSSGTTFLRNVSILGNWVGGERVAKGPGGESVTTGQDFELSRLDFVTSPGVDGADIDFLEAVAAGEAALDYAIAESAPEALVTAITETGGQPVAETTLTTTTNANYSSGVPSTVTMTYPVPVATPPEGAREALAGLFAAEASLPGTVSMSKRKSGMSSGGRKYADPGYQADHKQRYDITDKAHAIAAWRYINQASKAAKYSASQLKNIKARIRAALKGFGVKTAAEGWVILDAYQVTEAVAEFYGDPSKAGSWCITACNGPVNLSLSCYSMDPADMHEVITAAAGAACAALAALDPDMDGDIDVPGHGSGDTDDDGGHETEPEPEDPAAEDENEPAAVDDGPATETAPEAEAEGESPAPAGETERGDPAMAEEATTEAGGTAPAGLTQEDVDRQIAAALEADRRARKAAKKAKKAKESAPAAPVAESAPAPATPDIKALLAEALEEHGIKPPVKETEEERIQRQAREMFQGFVQEAVATGAVIPGRAGLQVREHAPTADEAVDAEGLAAMSDDDFAAYGGSALDKYMGDSTRHDALHT